MVTNIYRRFAFFFERTILSPAIGKVGLCLALHLGSRLFVSALAVRIKVSFGSLVIVAHHDS